MLVLPLTANAADKPSIAEIIPDYDNGKLTILGANFSLA